MSEYTNFHGDDVAPSKPEEALFHVIPVPYEKSVSYGSGTAEGPAAILAASCQLEVFDGKSTPAQYGICTYKPRRLFRRTRTVCRKHKRRCSSMPYLR